MIDRVQLLKHAWTTEQLAAADNLERTRKALEAVRKSRDEIRTQALEADWHRLRDIERDWRQLTNKVAAAAYVVGLVVLIAAVAEYL